VEKMESLAAASDFKSCEIIRNPVGMEIRLRRQPVAEQAAGHGSGATGQLDQHRRLRALSGK
jgi:hypothetical protein